MVILMKEVITSRQGISMVILLMLSEAFVVSPIKSAKSDIWLAILLGLLITCIIVLIYCRILVKFPDKNFFEILTFVFGNIIGNIIGIIYVLYCFYIGALVLSTFTLFTSIVGLENTPKIIIASGVIILVITGIKKGLEVIGRWSEFFARIVYPIIIITVILMLTMVEVFNLTPVLANGIKPVINGAFEVIAFPFAEIFTFLLIINTKTVKETKSIYKIFLIGLLLGGFALLITHVSAYLSLGDFAYMNSYFSVYTAVSRINIRDVIQRIEIIIAVIFIIGGFIKVTIYLLAGFYGVKNIFKLDDYKFIVTPFSIISLIISLTTVTSIMELQKHIYYYNYLAMLMQIILPLIILIGVEIKCKISKT